MRVRKPAISIWGFIFLALSACTTNLPAGTAAAPTAPASLAPTLVNPTQTPLPPTPTSSPLPTATQTAPPSPTPTPAPAVLVGAGDIAYCGSAPEYQGDEHTAALIQGIIQQYPDTAVMTVGDTVYGDGTRAELQNCFGPSWGQFKDRIHPAPGNHDYQTENGAPYYEYFGAAAGPKGLGYYSYNLGAWHIVVLNSNCDQIACTPDSQQVQWLRQDLQAHPNPCTLAYWHHPRWSSGLAGGGSSATFWKTAADMGIDVVVNGHDHDYERFAPMDASGNADPNGTREFVAGTGGAELRIWGKIKPNSEVRYNGTHGVLVFKLYPGRYAWNFIPAENPAMTDSGSGVCH